MIDQYIPRRFGRLPVLVQEIEQADRCWNQMVRANRLGHGPIKAERVDLASRTVRVLL